MGDTDLELVCIGDGPLREELSGRHVKGVRFVGPLPPSEVQAWMLRGRVLVAPSTWYETFGLVVAEAMAAGLPVIVPRDGALAEVAGSAAVLPAEGSVETTRDALVRSMLETEMTTWWIPSDGVAGIDSWRTSPRRKA